MSSVYRFQFYSLTCIGHSILSKYLFQHPVPHKIIWLPSQVNGRAPTPHGPLLSLSPTPEDMSENRGGKDGLSLERKWHYNMWLHLPALLRGSYLSGKYTGSLLNDPAWGRGHSRFTVTCCVTFTFWKVDIYLDMYFSHDLDMYLKRFGYVVYAVIVYNICVLLVHFIVT